MILSVSSSSSSSSSSTPSSSTVKFSLSSSVPSTSAAAAAAAAAVSFSVSSSLKSMAPLSVSSKTTKRKRASSFLLSLRSQLPRMTVVVLLLKMTTMTTTIYIEAFQISPRQIQRLSLSSSSSQKLFLCKSSCLDSTRRRRMSPCCLKPDDNNEEEEEEVYVFRGSDGDELPDDVWNDLEQSRPSEWQVMKELLGINGFTFLLTACIVFFGSMNVLLGPGWLGGAFALKGTGTFTEVSDALPSVMDLGTPEFQVK